MDITSPISNALQWSEGMLLSPQHFQQNDIYWHQQLWHRIASLQPNFWGVIDFSLVQVELQAGTVRVERLHAIFPDGLAVQCPLGCDIAPFNLNDPQIAWNDQRRLKLHLCVPIRTDAAASSNSDIRRFDSLPVHPTKDENTGDGTVEVGRLAPRLELLPESKVSGKYVSFPLLEVSKEAGNRFVLTDFHPPLLRISAAAFLEKRGLQELLPQLVRALRDKAKELIGDRRADDDEAQTYANPEAKFQLHSARMLTSALPPFEILVAAGCAHPFDLYLALAHIVGQAAAITADPMPPLLPTYLHNDALPAFRAAIDFLEERISRLQVATESIYFQKNVSESAFTCQLPNDLLADKLLIELKPGNAQTSKALTEWLNQARIASEELMPTLAARRLPGAQLKALEPSQVRSGQFRPDALLFEISNEAIDLENRRLPLFHRGSKLRIQGLHGGDAPANIVLHRTRIRQTVAAGQAAPLVPPLQAVEHSDGKGLNNPIADDPLSFMASAATTETVDEILDENPGEGHA
ncbi:type VI secretion system baseplate subunit TssK [Denitratisoma sp. agr-D3]